MKKTILNRFLFVVGITILAAIFATPHHFFGDGVIAQKMEAFRVTLGLDLAGGTELDYRIDLSDAIAQNNDDDPENDVNPDTIAESVRDSLEKRVNPAGIGEIVVKRSEVNGQQHILIQMPPSANVDEAKQNASRDNRLEFFEEDPALSDQLKTTVETALRNITPKNWDARAKVLSTEKGVVFQKFDEPRFLDSIHDPRIAEQLFAAREGEILNEVIETTTEAEYTIDENGTMTVVSFPKPLLGIIRVTEKVSEKREKTIPAEVSAQHILFAYPEALRAPEDVKYESKESAQAEAEKMLEQLKTNGTDNFGELAKEFSTETAAQQSGGDLGKFGPGQMVAEFDAAIFAATETGLLPEIIETDFGFHVIDVTAITPEGTSTELEQKIAYQLLGWDRSELEWEKTELSGKHLESANVGFDQVGSPYVGLLFNSDGGDLFAEITERVAARKCESGPCRLGIQVGGRWISTPTVREKIIGRHSQISGNFTFESAKELADGLNLGAIDAPVQLSGQMTIEPALGAEQLGKSLKAGALGLLATMIFMILSYRLPGVVASFALVLYAGLFITILKIWPTSFGGPIVLSLSGIAGIALSIGLAVDGNILIFERMKEELLKGRSLHQALDLGFERAWTAIRDSNLTTLITCIILYNLGSSMIKGFAITLIVGTLLSMFTAITISRHILHFSLLSKTFQKLTWFGIDPKDVKKSKK
ncbi:protein translocase subunit SecD [bacterium]|jgi:protein-export membrane protein SecD|nr:protein translocase subunit SecD [bacterium]MBT6832015.1 protein translocase subunit SecD [bacterium]MBT6996725.1 protein translocase subunit SecD [bacterium]MBT7772693.1 protein translocase subunit SecD [bacterium]